MLYRSKCGPEHIVSHIKFSIFANFGHHLVPLKSDHLVAFTFRVQRAPGPLLLEITGWTAKERTGSFGDTVVKTTALTTIIVINNWWISYPCFDRRVQNVSFGPKLPYTEGDSSRKPRRDRRCHFEFAIKVRFSQVISLIYINISESGNGNSQAGKPRA